MTSYESPLTDDEIRFLQQGSSSVRAIFMVVNKQDTVPTETRLEVLRYVSDTTKNLFNGVHSKPFSVSARDGLMPKESKKKEALKSDQAPALCLPHLEMVLGKINDPAVRRKILVREAAVMERTAEDMQRYAIKHDALRRYLVSKEENDAPLLGLQVLVGHRNVNSIFTVRDIL